MPDLKKGKECCGCTACAAVCPKDAISMRSDSLGFKYPEVNPSRCIECGLCERVCSFCDNYATPDNYSEPKPFGVRMKNPDEVMKSRSGGAFVAFSDWVLERGGVVYGAGFKNHFIVAHKKAETKEQRDEFRGSKYVQSDPDGVFRQIKSDLSNDRWVLFSGTPCQVAGLNSYIPAKLKEKLVTVDIVCHSVPAPNIWRDYLAYVERKEKKIALKVDFRDKGSFGWHAQKESFLLKDLKTGTVTKKTSDEYAYVFQRQIMMRPSCGNCHFCNIRRTGDLTLADFWGWEKTGTHLNDDDKGLSLVLINTNRGMSIFNDVEKQFDYFEPELKDCMQRHLRESTLPNPLADEFKKDYESHGFEYVWKKYGKAGLRYKIKRACHKFKTLAKLFRGLTVKEK